MMPLKPSVSACAAMALEYSMPVFISTSDSWRKEFFKEFPVLFNLLRKFLR